MAFTYAGDLSTSLDSVRFQIGDTSNAPDVGVKPGGYNFSDAEINGLIAREGNWQRATAAAYEALAALFAQEVDMKDKEISLSNSQKSKMYADLAKTWRELYGTGSGGGTVTASAMTRIDGYSDDVASDEV